MPCEIRRDEGEKYINFVELEPGEWQLRVLVEALQDWLKANRGQLDPGECWVADIGFCVSGKAAGGGPPISRTLMEMCLEANLEILLSEYPGNA